MTNLNLENFEENLQKRIKNKSKILLLHGEQDEIVRAKMVQEDVAELRKHAPATAIDFEEIAEIGHFELVDPASATWSNVEKAIMKLLRSE